MSQTVTDATIIAAGVELLKQGFSVSTLGPKMAELFKITPERAKRLAAEALRHRRREQSKTN